MALKFHKDAICLSGLTGTKLKCNVIGDYYPFWWGITSGGPSRNNRYDTSIVELNAATGEVYIEDTKETVLGSAGHALELKANTPNTENLKVILIEEDADCYDKLKKVMKRRWPSISIEEAEGPASSNSTNVYLLNKNLEDALQEIEDLGLGNTLYFFDPLRHVEYDTVETVAKQRLILPFKTGTEFFIFLFTSDWFLGRDDFSPLPRTADEEDWSNAEKKTVSEADELFGRKKWRNYLLNDNPIGQREKILINMYKNRLYRWFRYVLPLPFNPKKEQLFHLILCSNFETGIRATRNFYTKKTGNPRYSPSNPIAYERFRVEHPEIFTSIYGNNRPREWLILWKVITQHEEGRCDRRCTDIIDVEPNQLRRQQILEWLEQKGYLVSLTVKSAYDYQLRQYRLNWKVVREKLGVDPPSQLRPLSPEDIR